MVKTARARYTLEYKLEAVRMVQGGQSLAAVSKILGIADQTLHNWVKADREGRLGGAGSRAVSAEQMEIARLRAENGIGVRSCLLPTSPRYRQPVVSPNFIAAYA